MIGVTDVSGYTTLNAESHLGCISFHTVAFLSLVLASLLVSIE